MRNNFPLETIAETEDSQAANQTFVIEDDIRTILSTCAALPGFNLVL